MNEDPDTKIITKVCKSLIGGKISFNYSLTLEDGNVMNDKISNCNVIGDCLENIIYPLLRKKIPTIEEGPKQESPDFWNRNKKYEWELKTFKGRPNFDISNFTSYINQLSNTNGVKKKLSIKYIIFKYTIKNNIIIIDDCKICNIWELISYTGKYPISLQCKRNIWYNIRPCSYNDIKNTKNPKKFIQKLCDAIDKCPNSIKDKDNIIKKINKQFFDIYYQLCLQDIENFHL